MGTCSATGLGSAGKSRALSLSKAIASAAWLGRMCHPKGGKMLICCAVSGPLGQQLPTAASFLPRLKLVISSIASFFCHSGSILATMRNDAMPSDLKWCRLWWNYTVCRDAFSRRTCFVDFMILVYVLWIKKTYVWFNDFFPYFNLLLVQCSFLRRRLEQFWFFVSISWIGDSGNWTLGSILMQLSI